MEIVYVFFNQDEEIDRINFSDRKFLPDKDDIVIIGKYEGVVSNRHFNHVSNEIFVNIELIKNI